MPNKHTKEEDFFSDSQGVQFTLSGWPNDKTITLEEMYQHFRARLVKEIETSTGVALIANGKAEVRR